MKPRALLLLDNTPSQQESLNTLQTSVPKEVVYLPPSKTSLLQSLDQDIISNFKATIRWTCKQLFMSKNGQEQSIRDFWKSYIMKAIKNISTAWKEVSSTCMNKVVNGMTRGMSQVSWV